MAVTARVVSATRGRWPGHPRSASATGRRWWRLAALPVLLLLSAASGAQPRMPGITGADNREVVDVRGLPWRAIGRLDGTLGGFCTATVVGPRRILTAAHCLWDTRTGRWLPPAALHFLAAYQRGAYAVHARVCAIQRVSGFAFDHPELSRDWALLILDRDPAPSTGIIELTAVPSLSGEALVQAGYSRDRPDVLMADRSCRQVGASPRGDLILHDCDATFGDSGSPILVRRGGRYQLLGIHVALRGRGEDARGIAVTSGVFADWIAHHPATRPPGGAQAWRRDHPPQDGRTGCCPSAR